MKGFTLIEVIVTVAVTLVVTGFVIVNYNSYNDRQTLKQSGLTLKNNLRFAQTKALTGQIPPTVTCSELSGYVVSFAAKTYSIQATCDPEGIVGNPQNIDLPPSVTFSPVPSPITFNVLSRGTTLTSNQCLILTSLGQFYRISVRTNGDISDIGSGVCP